jgi:mono/diheme cytochrome c family protein
MLKGLAIGIDGTLAVIAAVVYGILVLGVIPANADGPLLPGEHWAAKQSLHAVINREAPSLKNPLQADESIELAGVKLYGVHCAVCHGASDGRPTYVGFGLYQNAPTLGFHGVEDDPEGEIYWKITHGLRFTGMPAFGKTLSETQRWQLTTFLKNMKTLAPAADAAWKKISVPTVPANLLPPRRPRAVR